jgi:hypothetical protein
MKNNPNNIPQSDRELKRVSAGVCGVSMWNRRPEELLHTAICFIQTVLWRITTTDDSASGSIPPDLQR